MSNDQAAGMTPDQGTFSQILRVVENSINDLSDAEKLELIGRIARSIPTDTAAEAERVRIQREDLDQFIARMETLPSVPSDDGFSNRDHDKILYGSTK